MAQNVSVYTIKDVAGVLPPGATAGANTLPLLSPDAVATDKAGNVYITDTGGHKVWKSDTAGKATVVLGTLVQGLPTFGKAAAGQPAGQPSGLAVDADGNLYIQGENNVLGLAAASPEGYSEQGRFTIPDKGLPSWAHPVISDGRLYVRNQDTLLVYDIKTAK